MTLRGSCFASVPLLLSAALLMSGCSIKFQSAFTPKAESEKTQTPIGEITGTVHGGQFPVSSAQIYLFAAATTGYGAASTSLITSGKPGVSCTGNYTGVPSGDCYVTTDGGGNFSLGGDYTCTAGTQVYMVAVGGNPGLSGSVNNTAIVQMAGLGQCPAAGNLAAQVPYLTINEVTTVAFAYSMGGFAVDAYHIGSSGTTAAQKAIANAMANAGNIVNLQWGQVPAVTNGAANGQTPQAKIYALANILGTCVNTSSAASVQCTNLFSAAKSSSNAKATDEAVAIFNIVHNPADTVANSPGGVSHVGTIWALDPTNPLFVAPPSPPNDATGTAFTLTTPLTSAPTDWTMPVIYTGLVSQPSTSQTPPAYTSGPFNIAFDANGTAWIGDRVKGVVEVGPQGASPAPFNNTGSGSFGMVKGVAVSPVDQSIWVADYLGNAVYVMDSTGAILQKFVTTANGPTINGPIMVAFSTNSASGGSLAYVANETTAGINVLNAGTYAFENFETTPTYGAITTPGWIAVDQSGTAWIPSTTSGEVGTLTVKERGHSGNYTWKGNQYSTAPESYSIVSDSSGNLWLGDISGTNQLEEITAGSTSAAVNPVGGGGGMNGPYKLAVDGSNTIWISNAGANTVSAYSSTSKAWLAASGFSTSAPGQLGCVVAAPDPSGNLWTANSDGSVTQLLGLATPTAAPLYGGANATSGGTTGNLGSEP